MKILFAIKLFSVAIRYSCHYEYHIMHQAGYDTDGMDFTPEVDIKV